MLTENELTPAAEPSESTAPADPHSDMDAIFAALGMDPHQFHGATADGEAKSEGSASGCPYARFFSGLFGGDKA